MIDEIDLNKDIITGEEIIARLETMDKLHESGEYVPEQEEEILREVADFLDLNYSTWPEDVTLIRNEYLPIYIVMCRPELDASDFEPVEVGIETYWYERG